jgi:hypothetical protein
MSKHEELSLIVERGLFVFEKTNLTEHIECDLDIYNSQIFDEVHTICMENGFPHDMKILIRKPDGSVCYCYCSRPSSPSTTNPTA